MWDLAPYHFLEADDAPPTVNPSLWRLSRLNALHGLLRVIDRIWLYSHSHADHCAGVRGVSRDEDVRARRLDVIAPERFLQEAVSENVLCGVEIEFQLTPGAEAPAEMNFFFPQLRALNLAENACHTQHNLCPLRGAKTCDALARSRCLDEALTDYVARVDVVFAQHHWPLW